jgi:hypothetical protein
MLFLILNTSDPRSSEHKDGIVASAPLTERLLSGYNSKFLMVGSLVTVQWRVFLEEFLETLGANDSCGNAIYPNNGREAATVL